MTSGTSDNGVLDRNCGNEQPAVPPRLEEDIGCAARSSVPVLITGDPEDGREIACAIDRRSASPSGAVEVVDCRKGGALTRVMSYAPGDWRPPQGRRAAILLLQEVNALSLPEQAEVDSQLAELRTSRRGEHVRIMASSSTPLFDRVLEGSFDERLYYRLNVIHMVVA
jgi:DNA-binding NtrC family response regulator